MQAESVQVAAVVLTNNRLWSPKLNTKKSEQSNKLVVIMITMIIIGDSVVYYDLLMLFDVASYCCYCTKKILF